MDAVARAALMARVQVDRGSPTRRHGPLIVRAPRATPVIEPQGNNLHDHQAHIYSACLPVANIILDAAQDTQDGVSSPSEPHEIERASNKHVTLLPPSISAPELIRPRAAAINAHHLHLPPLRDSTRVGSRSRDVSFLTDMSRSATSDLVAASAQAAATSAAANVMPVPAIGNTFSNSNSTSVTSPPLRWSPFVNVADGTSSPLALMHGSNSPSSKSPLSRRPTLANATDAKESNLAPPPGRRFVPGGDTMDPHGWYMRSFDSHLPSGRRDAVFTAQWLDQVEVMADAAAYQSAASMDQDVLVQSDAASGLAEGAHGNEVTSRTTRIDHYAAVFEEVVRQVSVGCIERGQVLARLWKHLSDTVNELEKKESQLISMLRKRSQEASLAREQLDLIAEERGSLRSRISTLEAQARWGNARMRIRRFQDTIKWRKAIQLAAREKEEVTQQLEKMKKMKLSWAFRAAAAQTHTTDSEHRGQTDEQAQRKPRAPSKGGSSHRSEDHVNNLIDQGLDGLKPAADPERIEGQLEKLTTEIVPKLSGSDVSHMSEPDTSAEAAARRVAEKRVVNGLLKKVMKDIDKDLDETNADIVQVTRTSDQMARLASDLDQKEKLLSEQRTLLRESRDNADKLQSQLDELKAALTAAETARHAAEQTAMAAERKASAEQELAAEGLAEVQAQLAALNSERIALEQEAAKLQKQSPSSAHSRKSSNVAKSQKNATKCRGTQTMDDLTNISDAPGPSSDANAAVKAATQASNSQIRLYAPKSKLNMKAESNKAVVLKKAQCSKTINELFDARLQRASEDYDSLYDNALDSLQDLFMHKYGLPSLAERNGTRFMASIKKHSESPTLRLFGRLLGVVDPPLGACAFNVLADAARALATLGIDPSSDASEVDYETMVKLIHSITFTVVADSVDYDAWWTALRHDRGKNDKVVKLSAIATIQKCARKFLTMAKGNKPIARSRRAAPEKPFNSFSSAPCEASPKVLAAHLLSRVCWKLPLLERPILKRILAPLLAAADVNYDGVISRLELGALVRAITPLATDKTIRRAHYEFQRAAGSPPCDEDGEESGVCVTDLDVACDALSPCGLRRLMKDSPLAVNSPLLSISAPDRSSDSTYKQTNRSLLPSTGSQALAVVESQWATDAAHVRALAGQLALPAKERECFAERLSSFEINLTATRTAVSGRGGGDEKLVATAAYAHRLLMMEAARLQGMIGIPSTRAS